VQIIFLIFKISVGGKNVNVFLLSEAKFWTVLTARGKNLIVRIENLRMNDQTDSDRAVSREDNRTQYPKAIVGFQEPTTQYE
jgi:hypothetical protein